MKKNLVKTVVIGAMTLTMLGSSNSKKLISAYESESNTINLKSSYKMTLFDSPDTPTEPDDNTKKEEVKNPKTGVEDYVPYAVGGIILTGVIVLLTNKKNKVYKI